MQLVHGGGVDIKWNGPDRALCIVEGSRSQSPPRRTRSASSSLSIVEHSDRPVGAGITSVCMNVLHFQVAVTGHQYPELFSLETLRLSFTAKG